MKFTIKVNKIPSVNSLYEFNPRTKSKYMSKEGKQFKEYLKSQLQVLSEDLGSQYINDMEILLSENKNILEKDIKNKKIGYSVNIIYILKSGINSRDLDNMNKATIDSIFEYLDINDNKIFNLNTSKIFHEIESEEKEFIHVEIKPIKKIDEYKLKREHYV